MANVMDALGKKVGPMPLGAWLIVGAGGLYIASRRGDGGGAPVATGDPLPTGGGAPSNGAVNSYDGAAVVLSPIFRLPQQQVKVDVNVKLPDAPKPAPVVTKPPPATPTVKTPAKPAPAPAPKPAPKPAAKPAPKPSTKTISYTIKRGDTLWGIAAKHLGSGTKWATIYGANKTAIEAAAKRHGRTSSSNGHWIYPGTVLKLTVKA